MSRGQLQLLKQILRAGAGNAKTPLAVLRSNFDRFTTRFPEVEGAVSEAVEIPADPSPPIRAEWVAGSPAIGASRERCMLYFHGGGFVLGSLASHRQLAARLSRAAGAPCLSVGYRLAPEHPYPAALEDALGAYRWLSRQAGGRRIAVAGDSAGAGLGLLTAVHLRERGEPLPDGLLCLSPWVDYEGTADSLHRHAELDPMVDRPGLLRMARLYLDGADPRAPEVSPLWADLRGLPPLLIQAGGSESLLDDARRLAEAARVAGVAVRLETWAEMIHGWHLFAGRLDEGREALERAGSWIRGVWARDEALSGTAIGTEASSNKLVSTP
ncbi:MAG: alpha/beta hydrolase [Holophagales bacterium]|nr:alpha/beta hydrolase [Holophagales bacterium]